jgi:hypothetical protein
MSAPAAAIIPRRNFFVFLNYGDYSNSALVLKMQAASEAREEKAAVIQVGA